MDDIENMETIDELVNANNGHVSVLVKDALL